MESLNNHFNNAMSKIDFGKRYLDYLCGLISRLNTETIAAIIDTIETAHELGNTIYFIGNGGSAASASHYANDIHVGTRARGLPPIQAMSLTDNLPLLTALANDEGYSKVFVKQLEGRLKKGDVLIALSVSGNSENVIEALEYAMNHGAITIGMTGFDGGKMRTMTDINLHIPTFKGEYGPVEDVFSIIGHLVYSFLKMDRKMRSELFGLQPMFAAKGA